MSKMTRDEILAMTAGPELDRLVRRLVWGDDAPELSVVFDREADCWAPRYALPAYSTDIAAAWEILPQFTCERRKDFFFLLTDAIRCRLGSSFYPRFSEILFLLLPEDICRAALLTIVEGANGRG